MRTVWLLRGGDVLASADVADSIVDRCRGLVGRPGYDGAMLFTRTRTVHSMGLRFDLDVAFLDRDLRVVATTRLRRWSVALPRRGGCHVLESKAGTFERWRLVRGDQIEIRETR